MQCLFNSLHGLFFFDFWGVMVYYYNVMKDIYAKILLTIIVICLVLLTLKIVFRIPTHLNRKYNFSKTSNRITPHEFSQGTTNPYLAR
jgi:hypothetical protein